MSLSKGIGVEFTFDVGVSKVDGVPPEQNTKRASVKTMVIRLLNEPRQCAQYVVTNLRPLGLGYVGVKDDLTFILAPYWHMAYL